MTIVKIVGNDQHFHTFETQDFRSENWMGDEWIDVPSTLTSTLIASGGYCDLTIIEGVLTDIIPVAPPAPVKPEPTQLDIISAQVTYTAMKTGTLIGGK